MNSTPASPKSPATKRHCKFYLEDAQLVVLQVEDTLFRVHKRLLLKSETFSDMFKVPKGTDDEKEEGTSDHPIVLKGVAASDFEALLATLYASYHPTHPGQIAPGLENSVLLAAFRLVHMWNFSDLRVYLLPVVEGALGDIDRILFAREFDVQSWLAPAHKNLCQRPEPLTIEEAKKLGFDSLLLISRMREMFRPPGVASASTMICCQSCAGVNGSGSTMVCTTCNQSSQCYSRVTTKHSASTTTALNAKINQWVVDGCVLKD
ncbi:hypothetical protein B0J17DRAFT_660678 [Rhizoctonia solani]|nr:hypothetical protein B0J17DRAFT_660678 [Rhizoctonia solani]